MSGSNSRRVDVVNWGSWNTPNRFTKGREANISPTVIWAIESLHRGARDAIEGMSSSKSLINGAYPHLILGLDLF